ncbi:MAG: cation:proton antiporter [Bacteroidales bacterium]
MKRNFTFYLIILVVFGSLIWIVLHKGENLKPSLIQPSTNTEVQVVTQQQQSTIKNSDIDTGNGTLFQSLWNYVKNKMYHSISILILQIIIIILFSRILGLLAGKIGQPIVIGEILAGIFLGPSLVGLYFPDVFSFIFPADSIKNLEILSQIGLVLFMFIIGMELDVRILRLRVKSALIISHTSIIFSFFLGVCLAYILFESYAPLHSNFTGFALFIGIAMSIAAFPVLARIIQERGLTKTHFGKTIITIAAIDDLTAWCILATIIAIIQAGNPINAIFTILMAVAYIMVMLLFMQPIMKKIGSVYITKEIISKRIIAVVFLILFLSAFFTEIIGIKALFGGFLAGVIMPQRYHFKKIMAEKIEDFSLVVLLPIFFVFTGLRTQIGLLTEGNLWTTCGLIILFAVTGKFGGSFIAARFTRQSLKDSLFIGILLNTRGLMELIVLNIGYDIGILPPKIFTMLVIMTIVTTFMTGPLLNMVEYLTKKKDAIIEHFDKRALNVLISFGNPKMGASLLKLLYSISGKDKTYQKVSALHLTPHTEITQSNAINYESNSFAPIKSTARDLNIGFKTIYKTTEDVTKEIIKTAKHEKCNLLLIGAAKSVFDKNALGGKVNSIMEQCKCNVGVFIDRDMRDMKNVLIMTDRIHLDNLIDISDRLIKNSECKITLMYSAGVAEIVPGSFSPSPDRVTICNLENTDPSFLNHFDLLITNIDNFERVLKEHKVQMDSMPSLFLINFKDDTFKQPINKSPFNNV